MSKFTNYDVEAQEQEMPVAVAVDVASWAAAPDVASGCDDKAEEDTGTDELGFSLLVGFILGFFSYLGTQIASIIVSS